MDKEINIMNNGSGTIKDIMTESELALFLSVSVYTVKRMRLKEGLPTLKFDNMRAILYYRPAVEDWLRARSLPWEEDSGEETQVPGRNEEASRKKARNYYRMAPIPD